MGKAGMKDSGKTTRLARARAARWIREMHFSVVAEAERKMGATWHAAARRMGGIGQVRGC